MIPLAMALPEHDAKYHQEHDYDKPYVVSQACEKTVTLPVEPVVSSQLVSNLMAK